MLDIEFPFCEADRGQSAMPTYLVSRYSSMPSAPPSRPTPEALTPPNGAAGLETMPWLMPDHAGLQPLGHPDRPGQIAGEGVGDQAELGVVGQGDALVVGVEGGDRGHRAEDLLAEHLGARRHIGEHGRRVEVPSAAERLAAGQHRAAGVHRVPDQLRDLVHRSGIDQRADLHAVVDPGPDGQCAPSSRRTAGRTPRPPTRAPGIGWPRCRPRRCCASWPASRRPPPGPDRRRRRPGTVHFRRVPSISAAPVRPTARSTAARRRWNR